MIKIGKQSVPVVFKYPTLSQHWPLIQQFLPLKNWLKEYEGNEMVQAGHELAIKSFIVEDVSFFGPRIGFLKFHLDACFASPPVVGSVDGSTVLVGSVADAASADDTSTPVTGPKVPGIVFMRGNAVCVLLLIKCPGMEPRVLFVRQVRIPIAHFDFWELPAGMTDNDLNFSSVASKELKEECGIDIKPSDMVLLASDIAVSPGMFCCLSLYLISLEYGVHSNNN